ncbi:hypothetical protein [Nocardia thailandica]|uniref:hypothetical protein n=1 Tax=Nocardia thailandica TaxID=257275 RepID=UPI0002D3D9BD|nr:hypothetical protein [Nocardia thailandica]
MKNHIPAPNNPAVVGLLKSREMRAVMFERGEIAQAIYREIVSKRTARLARSARVSTFIGGERNDRWCAELTIGESVHYGLPHEFGYDDGDAHVEAGFFDLNATLNMLGSL